MGVYENEDELGYFKAPLGRSAAQEDILDAHELTEAQEPFPGLPLAHQINITRAAYHAHHHRHNEAESARELAGYRWKIDPGGF